MRKARVTILLFALCTACASQGPRLCPKQLPAGPELPFSKAAHRLADFWLKQQDERRVLLDAHAIAKHNTRMRKVAQRGEPVARVDPLDSTIALPKQRFKRDLERLQQELAKGKRVLKDGRPAHALLRTLEARYLAVKELTPSLRVVLRSTPLRCYPSTKGLFESRHELAFDLGQCAQLRFGELVRVLGATGRYRYVRSGYAGGWVDHTALSAALDADQSRLLGRPPRFIVISSDRVGIWSAPTGGELLALARLGQRLPLLSEKPIDSEGPLTVALYAKGVVRKGYLREADRSRVSIGYTPLTRAAFMRRAFTLLHTPYGWGGMGDHRDCSRLLMDLFASFGVTIPRNSRRQSLAGNRQVDVSGLPEQAKRTAIEQASRDHLVMLYMPGHIMLYVGRDGEHLYALHLFSGYLTRCGDGGETMNRVNRTAITSLELGRGTSRRAFIERITQLVLLGDPGRSVAR